MNQNDSFLQNLIELAERLSVRIVFENLKDDEFIINSGMCSVKGDTLIIIDSRSSVEEKIKTLCRELKKFNLENIFIQPALREMIDEQNGSF